MAGGGVRGKGGGIAHGTIAQAGHTIMLFHLSMEGCLRDGETITGRTAGRAGNGVTKEYRIRNFGRFIKGIIVSNPDGSLK